MQRATFLGDIIVKLHQWFGKYDILDDSAYKISIGIQDRFYFGINK